MKLQLLTAVCLLLGFQSMAQSELFMPRNFVSAYEDGTRSYDGKPGPNYWQNQAEYKIQVSIDPKKLEVSGKETVVYTNNSPDTLRSVRFKLAADRYRKGSLRSGDVNPDDVTEKGVDIKKIAHNGDVLGKGMQRQGNTYLYVRLASRKILPGESATFDVEWSYTLPEDDGADRECVCDPTTYFVPYFYPQIAVYDDYHGWATAPYNGTQEFYHDFANYDVTITMPKGFMVWATGEWQNAKEMLQAPFYKKWEEARTSEKVVSIWKEKDMKDQVVFKKSRANVFHYKAENVPDFTFATSDHYNWDARSVVVDKSTGRRTFVSAAYNTDSEDYYEVASIASQAVELFSTWLPGYPFPYPCLTIFNGDDGMEFPMMVNDASVPKNFVASLTVHEAAHTYFPFMMGINEQDYAWMDEGWANFFDSYVADSITGRETSSMRGYSRVAGTDYEVPPMVRSQFLTGSAYGIASYSRPQAAYTTLMDMLGYETFHKCLTEYMDRWKGKHPMPYDFFFTFNDVSGQDLNWFWKPWFFDWAYPDLAIKSVGTTSSGGGQEVEIERIGDIPVAIHLKLIYADGTEETVHRTADVWKTGLKTLKIAAARSKELVEVKMGHRRVPDSNRSNNTWKK